MKNNYCLLCGGKTLHSLKKLVHLNYSGVTSDCKPWPRIGVFVICTSCGHLQKKLDEQFFVDIKNIYSQYEMYPLSGGMEQVVFTDFESVPRTVKLLDNLCQNVTVPSMGNLLDIGCGNGSFLRSFNKQFPDWNLYGYEQNDSNRNLILGQNGVQDFFSELSCTITQQFDIISMIYVIEHMIDPVNILQKFKPYLKQNGILFIQTSAFLSNPFDLIVADHCSHFQIISLQNVAKLAGFDVIISADDWNDKEIGIVAKPSTCTTLLKEFTITDEGKLTAEKSLAWLEKVKNHAVKISEKETFGVFGTALAGTWLASLILNKIDFFVDEDSLRQGKTYMGLKVKHPENVPDNAVVYLVFPSILANKLYTRLQKKYSHIKFIVPPSL